mmetsp:Transcript_95386/g.165673  ORF Transcript_95386/g.165673 Transcript_95386/m.165673 type:complete len:89 (-) Transcript_95386:512-778(-)
MRVQVPIQSNSPRDVLMSGVVMLGVAMGFEVVSGVFFLIVFTGTMMPVVVLVVAEMCFPGSGVALPQIGPQFTLERGRKPATSNAREA